MYSSKNQDPSLEKKTLNFVEEGVKNNDFLSNIGNVGF